jgi:tetratricopeptide (TPR) repeat protein
MLAGVLAAVLGILQYLLEVDWVLQLRPPAASFSNRNMAAQFMVATIPLAVSFFLVSRKRTHVWLAVMAVGIPCLFLFYTSTRSAWLAVTIEFLFFALLLARDRFTWNVATPIGRQKIKAIVLGVAIGFVFINLTPSGFQWQVGKAYNRVVRALPRLKSSPSPVIDQETEAGANGAQSAPFQATGTQGTTLTVRMNIWQNTLRMGQENLIGGVGLGNFGVFYPRYARSAVVDQVFDERGQWQRAHNDYVQSFAELGVVGLFFLGWLLLAVGKTSAGLLGQPKGEQRYLMMGLLVALSGLSVSAFFSFPFQMVTPTFIFALYLGVLGERYSRWSIESEGSALPRKATILLSSWIATVGVGITLLLLMVLLPFEYNRLRADWHFKKMGLAETQKDWVAVITHAKQGHEYYPYRKEFLFRMGKGHFERGELDAGIEATKEFLETYPYYANAHHNVGMAYALKGDEESAFHHFNEAIETVPNYARTHFAAAQLYELQKNMDKALEHYRAAVRTESRNGPYHLALGQAAFKEELFEEAMDAFSRAAEIDPENSEYFVSLGITASRLRLFEEARTAFERAVELEPKSVDSHYRLGTILFLAFRERDEAIRHFEEVLRLDPSSPYADQIRQFLESDSP